MSTAADVVAVHEAGHAVAAVMRGGSTLSSVTVHSDGSGLTNHSSKQWDAPFIAYAGPWAEARQRWQGDGPELDSVDANALAFSDYVTGVCIAQPDDLAAIGEILDASTGTELVWHRELSRAWSAIQSVAAEIARGATITDELVRSHLDSELEEHS